MPRDQAGATIPGPDVGALPADAVMGPPPGTLTLVATLWRVLRPELRLYGRRLLTDLALAFATALSGALGPYLLYLLLRDVQRGDPVAAWSALVAGLLLSLAAFAVFKFAHNHHALATSESLFLALKQRLVEAVLRKPAAFHNTATRSGLTSLVARDLDKISSWLRLNAGPMMAGVLVAALILGALLWLDWRPGLLVAVLTGLYLYLSFRVHRIIAAADHRTRGADSRQQLILTDILSGAHEIRLFQIQDQHRARFARAADAVRLRNIAVSGTPVRGFRPRLEFTGSMILIGPALLGLWLVSRPDGGAGPALIPAFMTYCALLLVNLQAIDAGVRALAVLGDGLRNLDAMLHHPEEAVPAAPDLDEMPVDHTLQLVGITRRFGTKQVLAGIDLTIAPGERLAVTGPSGIGKTTLANLILRLDDPDGGRLLLGGQPVRRFPLPLYLSYFAHVGQTTHLFHASVRDNIGMGWQHVPFEDIVRAAELVRLHDAIMQLPAGYDTIIGDGEVRLSLGQRQRLALARALIREPAILVLDEFTAALDSGTEDAILTDLVQGFPGTTIICLTHSAQVVRRMDRVFRIPDLARAGVPATAP
jgi:ATP-binding cassette, subfamily B, bacterial